MILEALADDFTGRRAIVTGAASGIGKAIADALIRVGAEVGYADLDGSRAQEAAADSSQGWGVRVDVASESSVEELFAQVRDRWDGLDYLVNVAGVQRAGSLLEASVDDWDAQMNVNARGTFLMMRRAVPMMAGRKGAAIVNVASAGGVRGFAGLSGYSASKAAVIALTRCAAKEIAPTGIRVNALSPGWVDTPFNDPITAEVGGRPELEALVEREVPQQRQATPAEIATSALFLLSSATSYADGHNFVFDGGFTA